METKKFERLANAVVASFENIDKVFIDNFNINNTNYQYLVVVFKGGSMSVRNVKGNSLIANLKELVSLIDGGYYKEVKIYKDLKKKAVEHTCVKHLLAGILLFDIFLEIERRYNNEK